MTTLRPLAHEVLAVVLRARERRLEVLLWQRALPPFAGRWALPGGDVRPDETFDASIRRQLAEKVDLTGVAHLEQFATASEPDRSPDRRVVATAYLGLVPTDTEPVVPPDTAWHPAGALPPMAGDHGSFVRIARDRLRARLSYTNLGFALAPARFTMSELRDIYVAALGHEVSAVNLQRVLDRRHLLEPTGDAAPPGPAGGRPARRYRFRVHEVQVTDEFAALRPPSARPR
jgi:ADP-ribose pyrophosphatase YjhB (NUDIX family)